MTTVVACPACQLNVRVPQEMLEQPVQCPDCGHTFTAAAAGSITSKAPPPLPAGDVPEWEKPRKSTAAEEEFESPLEEDEDEEEKQRRKRKRDKGKSGPSSKTYDDLMKRQRQKAKGTPHRGVMILIFGIVAVGCPTLIGLVFGILAWNWGTNDLNEMMCGRMDPDGETLTKVGRILGLVGVCLTAFLFVLVCTCSVLGGLVGH
jgi:hypothetical protein